MCSFVRLKDSHKALFLKLASLLLFLFHTGNTNSQIPAIRQLNLRQGLPQSEVTCLLEDSRGLIWAGTRGGGLVQLDGNSLRIFNTGKGLASDFISDVQEFPDGRLCISTFYGGIQSFDGKKFSPAVLLPENSDHLKTAISDNKLVFDIHNEGITRIDFGKNRFRQLYQFQQRISDAVSAKLLGKRWLLVSTDSGLYSVDTKSLSRSLFLGRKSHLNGRLVSVVHGLNSHSAVLVSSDGKTAVLDFEQGWPLMSEWKDIPGLVLSRGEDVRFVIFGIGQYIKLISTSRNRLISFKTGVLDLSRMNGMKTPPVSALITDRNGSLWIGTSGSGIWIRPVQSALSYSENSLLANGRLKAVLKSENGDLFCGGEKTGLIVTRSRNSKESVCLFPETDVSAVSENKEYLFVGTSSGLRVLRKKDLVQENFFEEPGKTIRLHVLKDGRLLIGTFGNGAWIMKPGERPEKLIPKESGLMYPYDFVPYKQAEFLIPSNSGLWKYNLSSGIPELFSAESGSHESYFHGTRDLNGNFWFSANDGIVRMRGREWTKVTTKNGLSSGLIYTLNADSVGNIWVGGSHGLDKIILDRQSRIRQITNYGPEEGFDGYEANMRASFVDRDFLYICTIQGLFAMPVKEPGLDPLPVKPEITGFFSVRRNRFDSLAAGGKQWYHTNGRGYLLQEPELLIFDFKSINPLYPSKIKYSYRIAGKGENWSKPSYETRASFPAPEAGEYAFEVKSTYDGNFFSEPSRLEFKTTVPWYTGKFVIIPAALFILFLLGVYLNQQSKKPEARSFFRRDLKWSEKNGRLFLLIFTVLFPLLPFLATRFDPGVCLHPVESLVLTLILACLFFLSVRRNANPEKIKQLLRTAFFVMVADSLFGIVHNNFSPFYAGLLFAVSCLAFGLFTRPLFYILYALLLNGFAFFAAQITENPVFNPVSFQLASAVLSIAMLLVMLAMNSSEINLRFAGKVVNEGPVLVLAFDEEGNLGFTSGNIEPLTGFKPDELSGKEWEIKLVPGEADRLAMNSIISDPEKKEIRISLKTRTGEKRVFRFQGKSLDQRFRVLLGEDISEKEFLESRFEYLVENATDSIFLTDTKGKILYSNPESTFMLGLNKEELIGRYYTEFVVEEYQKSIRSFYENQLAEKISGSYQEFPVLTRGKQVRWMAFQTSLLYERDGQSVEGLLAIGRDITERIETEQLILIQHKNITDSITYASRIRSAMQPEKDLLAELFTQVAVLDEPRDIIGGDFFWLSDNGPLSVFALGDCTGHGVPGAFMTTISISILREIVKENEQQNLEILLAEFNRSLNRYLGRNGRDETMDFAELALISIDYENRDLLFISSGIALYRLRNGEISCFREASRGFGFRFDYSGMSHRIPLEPGDVFYLFTDGMYDQIGGDAAKRLSKTRLLQLIQQSDVFHLEKGLNQIKNGIQEWQGKNQQTDDRMLISFRF